MIAGFEDRLHCVGIIGDGCGGERVFYIDNETLYAYDTQTKQSIKLLQDIKSPSSISKSACIITIELKKEVLKFNLSTMKIV